MNLTFRCRRVVFEWEGCGLKSFRNDTSLSLSLSLCVCVCVCVERETERDQNSSPLNPKHPSAHQCCRSQWCCYSLPSITSLQSQALPNDDYQYRSTLALIFDHISTNMQLWPLVFQSSLLSAVFHTKFWFLL